MGIVASLAAAPIASEIALDEKRRDLLRQEEEERLRRQRELEFYRQGDVDLEVIKRYTLLFERSAKRRVRTLFN